MTPRLHILLQWVLLAVAALLPMEHEETPSTQTRFEVARRHAPDGVDLGESVEAEEVDGEESSSDDEQDDGLGGTPTHRARRRDVRASSYRVHAPRGPPSHVTTRHTRAHPPRGPPAC